MTKGLNQDQIIELLKKASVFISRQGALKEQMDILDAIQIAIQCVKEYYNAKP